MNVFSSLRAGALAAALFAAGCSDSNNSNPPHRRHRLKPQAFVSSMSHLTPPT